MSNVKRKLILSESIEGPLDEVLAAERRLGAAPTVDEIRTILLEGYAALALLARSQPEALLLSQRMKAMRERLGTD